MERYPIGRLSLKLHYLISISMVLFVSSVCFALSGMLPYRVVALILLLVVSFTAMVFDILPVLLTAVLSAMIWDFFFIPPHFTFQIATQEDVILLVMYFVIAMGNAALTYKIRRITQEEAQKEEKANTLKLYNTLFNSLSHELRTPIAAIIGATDNLQSGNKHLNVQQRQELVQEIGKASLRLNDQVANLLNMSRIESGALQPHKDWCDIQETIYEVVQRIEAMGISQRINVSVPPDFPLFLVDEGLLEPVLLNLLQNAAKYTPENSLIAITAIAQVSLLELRIEDNGPGFPSDKIELAFDKFFRLNNSKPGGTGLGLSIVKGFVEAMGGNISLKNKPEGGAAFKLKIPAETSYLKNLKHD